MREILRQALSFLLVPYRYYFPKSETKSLDEFIAWVKKESCRYVSVHTEQFLVTQTSDYGYLEYGVHAHACNRFGFVFTLNEKTGRINLPSFGSFEEQKKDELAMEKISANRATELCQMLKVAIPGVEVIDGPYDRHGEALVFA